MERQRKIASLSGSRQRKNKLLGLLRENNFKQIQAWAGQDTMLLRPASGLLFHGTALICWRAVKALGIIAAEVGPPDPERIRLLIRQQLWHMNDESGNVGWFAPQAVAELCVSVPELIEEYSHRLVSFFDEEPFEIGAHWGVARIAEHRPDVYTPFKSHIVRSLRSPEPAIRYYALKALSLVDDKAAREVAPDMINDETAVQIFDIERGAFSTTTVAELATQVLQNPQ
ncbi:MAG: DVU0298 family protein [bacterium]